jgi:hypothetical protein
MRTSLTVDFIMILVVATTCKAASSNAPSTPIKLSILGGCPVVHQVFLNGQGPYRFLLDTGAQTNQVEAGLARKLGLTATFQVDLDTAAGSSRVAGGRVGRVTLGSAEATNQEFLFTSLDGLHVLSPDIRGILGQEFLAHFDYTLDFHNRQMRFGDSPSSGIRVPVRLIDGRMAVATSQGELVLDSGTDTLILFRSSSQSAAAQIRTASNLVESVAVRRARELRIGDHLYHPANAVFCAPCSSGRSTREDGLLPASLFHAIFISNSGGYVLLDPLARR